MIKRLFFAWFAVFFFSGSFLCGAPPDEDYERYEPVGRDMRTADAVASDSGVQGDAGTDTENGDQGTDAASLDAGRGVKEARRIMVRVTLLLFVTFTFVGCIESGTLEVEDHRTVPVIDTPASQTSGPATDDPTVSDPTTPADNGGPTSTDTPTDSPTDSPNTDPMCTDTQALCDGACIDVSADDANCGDCGVMCGSGTVCMGSDCVCEVGELCDGACVDTNASFEHCGTCGNSCSGGQACVDGGCMNVGEVEGVLIATNQARMEGANCGVYGQFAPTSPLEGDPELHEAAQVHADDMSNNNFFSHTGSDGSSFSQRIGRTDFSGQPIGENIAAGQNSPESVVAGWLDSDGHCRNLMNPSATKIGIGYQTGGPYGTLWVQVFAR